VCGYDEDYYPKLDVGPNLNVGGDADVGVGGGATCDVKIDGIIDIEVEEDAIYGIKIVNNTDTKLYPSLFYFDNSDLSILSYYQPPTTSARYQLDAPLPPRESLTIGYGSGGAAPLTFSLREGQDVDVGFLKLFLTTKPVDFSKIPQGTPFGREGHRELQPMPEDAPGEWDTITIMIVQRRGKAS